MAKTFHKGVSRTILIAVIAVVLLGVLGFGGWQVYNRMAFNRLKAEAERAVLDDPPQYERAITILRDIQSREGETEWSLELLCRAYIGLGQFDVAAQYVNTLTRNYMGNISGHVMAGEVHFHRRMYEEALSGYQEAEKLQSDNLESLIGMAKSQFMLGKQRQDEQLSRWRSAEANLARAMQLDPDSGQANRWMAELALEEARARPAEQERAMNYAQTAVRVMPNSNDAHRVLGNAQLLAGDLQAAEQSLDRALNLRRDAVNYHALGIVQFRRRNLEMSAERLGTAVKQEPDNPQYLMDHASVLSLQEKWDEANAALQRASELDPHGLAPILRQAMSAFHVQRDQDALDGLRNALSIGEPSPALHYEVGCLAYLLARPDEPLQAFRQVLRLDPNSARAHFNVGTLLLQGQDFAGAEQHLSRAGELADDDPSLMVDAKMNLGLAYFNSNRPQRATEVFREILARDPENVWGLINHGIGLTRQGNVAEAEESFRRAIQLRPSAFDAHLNLGLLYSASQRFDDALETLQEARRLRPSDTDEFRVQMSLGLVYYQMGDLTRAQAEFGKVLASPSPMMAQKAKNSLVCVALKQGEYRQAATLVSELLSSPDIVDQELVLLNQAIAQIGQGQTREALAVFERVMTLAPQQALAYYNRGVLRYAGNDFGATTVADFQRASREDPQLAEAHYNLALVFERQRDHVRAEAEYRKALAVRESFIDALINLALLRVRTEGSAADLLQRAMSIDPQEPRIPLVRAYEALLNDNPGEAINAGRQAVAGDDSLQQAHALLGFAYLQRDQLHDAQASLGQAITLNPEDSVSRLNYGRLLHLQGELLEAERNLVRARDLDPEAPETYKALVALYVDMWLYEEALEAVRTAMQLAPDDASLARTEGMLLDLMTREEPGAELMRTSDARG